MAGRRPPVNNNVGCVMVLFIAKGLIFSISFQQASFSSRWNNVLFNFHDAIVSWQEDSQNDAVLSHSGLCAVSGQNCDASGTDNQTPPGHGNSICSLLRSPVCFILFLPGLFDFSRSLGVLYSLQIKFSADHSSSRCRVKSSEIRYGDRTSESSRDTINGARTMSNYTSN